MGRGDVAGVGAGAGGVGVVGGAGGELEGLRVVGLRMT